MHEQSSPPSDYADKPAKSELTEENVARIVARDQGAISSPWT